MANREASVSKKHALVPGAAVYVGNKSGGEVRIEVIDYSPERFEEKNLGKAEECRAYAGTQTVTWLNVTGVHDTALVKQMGEIFGIHPLVVEDIVNTNHRPKYEEFGTYTHIMLKMLSWNPEKKQIRPEHVSIVFGKDYVISFQEDPGDLFDAVRQRIRDNAGRIRKQGPDYLAYSLIDTIVDHYFIILEHFGDRIASLEDDIHQHPSQAHVRRLHVIKREMIFLRRSIWPVREILSGFLRSESETISAETKLHLRDVYDHTIQIIETVESYREMLTGILDLYLSSSTVRLNEVMKILTIIATVFTPPTFIASVYGMNFQHMPELQLKWGYYAVLGLLGVMIGGMLYYFIRKGWLRSIRGADGLFDDEKRRPRKSPR